MFNQPLKILLAEDDINLGLLLHEYMLTEGFEITLCKDGVEALKAFEKSAFDLCLLDVMMPKLDGFSLAKEIRLLNKKTPIIFITAKSLKEDKIKGYRLEADDYVCKPFDVEELVWKIKALIRRMPESKNENISDNILIGAYSFDFKNQTLTFDSKIKRITEKESQIINYLFKHRNQLIKREIMLKELWGENDYFLGRSLDVFLTKIRKYLHEDPQVKIENIFGVGFIFNVPIQKP